MEIAGERLVARGDRTLFWPERSTLFVADLHLGKGAAFRAGGVPVPTGSTAGTLDALSRTIETTQARQVVVLGDLWHARAGRTDENRATFARWRETHADVKVRLVLGNHDRHAGWDLDAEAPGEILGPFALNHFPEPDPRGYVLSGHLHPGVRIGGFGGDSLRLPCFWFGREVGVLPAFGELTGISLVRPGPDDKTIVVAEERVAIVPNGDRSPRQRR